MIPNIRKRRIFYDQAHYAGSHFSGAKIPPGAPEEKHSSVVIRIIIVDDRGTPLILVNPRILAKSGEYEAEEGCLSLTGKRKAIRYEKIRVAYENEKLQPKSRTFTGWTAQIIQHEMDHCEGILI